MTTSTRRGAEEVRTAVRQAYGAVAIGGTAEAAGCCGGTECCGGGVSASSAAIGYTDEDRASVPDGADLGLGCGNPQAIAALRPGERVLDLGSGAGFDVFLAARQVGHAGHVIGVDMTPEMVTKATVNRAKVAVENVEFRLGEIEHLPVADSSVDVIMSNCVINLSPDKAAVFREAFRVLAPGGRLAISDIIAVSAIPSDLRDDLTAHTACVAGAAPLDDIRRMLADAGFDDVQIDVRTESRTLVEGWAPGRAAEDYVASALIRAVKPVNPAAAPCCESTLVGRCCTPADEPDRS